MMNKFKVTTVEAYAAERAKALPAIILALIVGAFLVVGTGFAGVDVLHNAAHDSRHAMGFPCH